MTTNRHTNWDQSMVNFLVADLSSPYIVGLLSAAAVSALLCALVLICGPAVLVAAAGVLLYGWVVAELLLPTLR
jgi:hypothetical protein